jgi:hypothetical protein
MCYEFWRQESVEAEEERARREAQRLIQKARTAPARQPDAVETARREEKDTELAPV